MLHLEIAFSWDLHNSTLCADNAIRDIRLTVKKHSAEISLERRGPSTMLRRLVLKWDVCRTRRPGRAGPHKTRA